MSAGMLWNLQTCRKCTTFSAQNWDFQKFPQKCVTCDIQNFGKGRMICNIIEEITGNQADLHLSEKPREVFPQSSCKKMSLSSSGLSP